MGKSFEEIQCQFRRRGLRQAKRLLRIQEEEFINDQLADTGSDQEEGEIPPTQVTRETSQTANQHVQNENTSEDPLSQNHKDEYINVNMLQDLKSRFEHNFNAMKKADKWYLSSGKCVEDELYAFGMQCMEETS
ncbi:hypothetical protein INT47_005798 [Mucor saturninus]|uniref:Uncharacterized protein n=1 Tax=Mucor saturninus TaxID=64648 RepID=A0A8H7QXN1_9FUNG|nr:hypothetical protein INT47_005798 [Mucor saturninus]